MKYRSLAFTGFFLFLNLWIVKGQISMTMGYRQSSMNFSTEVPIFLEDPTQTGFSTVGFSKQFPNSKIPSEELKVNFPNMSGAIDTVGILWYLKPENYSPKGEVNIILIGLNSDSSKTYYIDNNNDRTFADNEEIFVFKPVDDKRILEIRVMGFYNNYTLLNPDYSAPVELPSRIKEYFEEWHRTLKKPSINADFSFLSGGGHAALYFKPLEGAVNKYDYFANIVGCFRPSVGIDFSWYNIHILFSGSFERLQYDETARFGYRDQVIKPQRDYNSDPWMETKLHAGVSAEYDFGLFRRLWITPFGSYSVYKNTDNKIFDRQFPHDGAEYKDMHSTEFGLKLKLPTAGRTLIYIKVSHMKSWFDASEFLPEYVPGSYSVDYRQTYFGVGVQYRLFKNKTPDIP
jgi:hypothetical protein